MKIAELLSDLRIEHRQAGNSPHVTDGWIGVVCPFCGVGTGKFGMGISIEGGHCTCWKCGPHRLGDVLAAITGEPIGKVLPLLGKLDHVPWKPKERPTGKLILPNGVGPLEFAHRSYLKGRGFDAAELVRLWRIGGIGLNGQGLAWRLFIPIERGGRTVSWTTRAIGGGSAKYSNAKPGQEEIPAKTLLYGADYCRHAIIVVEGPTDAWRIGPGAAATLGLGWTRKQLAAIARYPVRAVCFDSEPAAQERARRMCDELECFPGRTSRVVLDAADPGSATRREVARLRREFLE